MGLMLATSPAGSASSEQASAQTISGNKHSGGLERGPEDLGVEAGTQSRRAEGGWGTCQCRQHLLLGSPRTTYRVHLL